VTILPVKSCGDRNFVVKSSWERKPGYISESALILTGFYVGLILTTDFMGKKLPVLSSVRPFKFERHDGKVVTERDVLGKVVIVEYFFTTCKGICPKMNRNMQEVYRKFKGTRDFLILSHTVDPETDSVARLRQYYGLVVPDRFQTDIVQECAGKLFAGQSG
jgi:protein SCO1/2